MNVTRRTSASVDERADSYFARVPIGDCARHDGVGVNVRRYRVNELLSLTVFRNQAVLVRLRSVVVSQPLVTTIRWLALRDLSLLRILQLGQGDTKDQFFVAVGSIFSSFGAFSPTLWRQVGVRMSVINTILELVIPAPALTANFTQTLFCERLGAALSSPFRRRLGVGRCPFAAAGVPLTLLRDGVGVRRRRRRP